MTAKQSEIFIKSVLVSAILVVVGVYFFFFLFMSQTYSPYYEDEFFYFKNSESFMVHSSLEAAFTYGGSGSRLFGIDPHGPAYPLLYGLVSKVVGWHNLNILIINFSIFLFALIGLIVLGDRDQKTTQMQVLLVLGCPVSLFYSITFLAELIHLAGGIFLYLICKRYLNSYSKRDFYALFGLILILGFFRNTWFFALIGLMILPSPLNGYKKSILAILGMVLPFLFQYFLHEQVPNTFSGLSGAISEKKVGEAIEAVIFNFQRNIYFAFTYTEGLFYTLQKIWQVGTLILAFMFAKNNKLIQFGVLTLGVLIIFNLILYKNYTWVDLRLYTPLVLFLNCGLLAVPTSNKYARILLFLNLISFVLVIPLQNEMIRLRMNPDVKDIPKDIEISVMELETEFILVDTAILKDFAFYQLPIKNRKDEPIRYILPYYTMPMKDADFILTQELGQLKVSPRNILSQ